MGAVLLNRLCIDEQCQTWGTPIPCYAPQSFPFATCVSPNACLQTRACTSQTLHTAQDCTSALGMLPAQEVGLK